MAHLNRSAKKMTTSQKSALRYWEVRRGIFIALVAFAFNWAWGISNCFDSGVDDLPLARISDPGLWRVFLMTFIMLNALFSIGYVAEFFLEGRRLWPKPSRTFLLLFLMAFGCFYSMRVAAQTANQLSLQKAVWPAMYGNGGQNQPLQGTPAKAPSSSTEPEGRRS